MILTYFNLTLCSLCTGHSSPDGAIIVQDNRKELFVTTPPQLTSDASGSASPPTVRSLTDLPSQHSQVSLFPICVNNIHRSVTHQTTLTTFMGKSLTHQSSPLADPRRAPGTPPPPPGVQILSFLCSFRPKIWEIIAILGVGAPHRENPGSATALNIHKSVTQPSTLTIFTGQSLHYFDQSLYRGYLRADADAGSVTLKCLHHISHKNIKEDLVGFFIDESLDWLRSFF